MATSSVSACVAVVKHAIRCALGDERCGSRVVVMHPNPPSHGICASQYYQCYHRVSSNTTSADSPPIAFGILARLRNRNVTSSYKRKIPFQSPILDSFVKTSRHKRFAVLDGRHSLPPPWPPNVPSIVEGAMDRMSCQLYQLI